MAEGSTQANPKQSRSDGKSGPDLKSKVSYLPEIHRLLPQAPEAEQGVLSSFLLAPREVGVMCAEAVIKGEHFHIPAHAEIYEVLLGLWDKGSAFDFIAITQSLRDRNKLEAVGGAGFITSLYTFLPTAANAAYYIDLLQEKYVLRQIIRVCTEYAARSYDEQGEVTSLLDKVEQEIFAISKDRYKEKGVTMKDMVRKAISDIEILHSNRGKIMGLETGFKQFDQMSDGLHGAEMMVVAARPSMGKCLAANSEILLADGSVTTIGEIYRRRAARLLTLGDNWKFRFAAPSAFVDDGEKPTFRVTTKLGRTVVATQPHPFLTVRGWKPLGELQPGEAIAVPRELPVFGDTAARECEVKLLAYLLGDGGLSDTTPEFTNTNPRVLEEFTDAAVQFGGLSVRASRDSLRAPTLSVSSCRSDLATERAEFGKRLTVALANDGRARRVIAHSAGVLPSSLTQWAAGKCVPADAPLARLAGALDVSPSLLFDSTVSGRKNDKNRLTRWLDSLGLWGRKSAEKFVPSFVFRLPHEQLVMFLNRLFATDGWACVLRTGQAQAGYASTSERLARQGQHLLLRFGIIAKLRARSIRYRDERRPAWQLDITDGHSLRKLAEEVGIFGKEGAVEAVAAAVRSKNYQTNSDLIPIEIWDEIRLAKGNEPWVALARRAGIRGFTNIHAGRRRPTRDRLSAFARALQSEKLAALAESEVYWDEIVSIEPLGRQQVYDLTIPETHNFVANDICVHNTAFAMNIAEHMALNLGHAVAVFSLEMSAQQLVQRLLCSIAKVNMGNIRNGFMSERDFPNLAAAAKRLAAAKILIDDTSGLTIGELRAKARRMKAQSDIQAIFIDYLQLLRSPSKRGQENRQIEISEISNGIKALAKELNIPILVLAQLNRGPESRTGDSKGRPRLSDLRESGSIEQDADIVGLLVREEYYAETDAQREEMKGKATLIIAKQRNGPVGDVPLTFLKEFTRFEDRADAPEPQG